MHISLIWTVALVASMLVAPASAEATADPACESGTHYVDESNGGRTVLRFTTTTPCEWTRPTGVSAVDVLVVGGGGGGGAIAGAGGGGGAVVSNAVTLNSATYTITVGTGGAGASMFHGPDSDVATNTFTAGTNGGASSISGADITITAPGGGVGGSWDGSGHQQAPGSGGSGGGSGSTGAGGTGNPGGNGGSAAADGQPHATGGGGGAGGNGGNGSGGDAGAGGYWVNSDIITRGSPEAYGGGGGGSTHGTWSGSTLDTAGRSGDGDGGGGDGGSPTQSASGTVFGGAGTDGRGGGGGGAANNLVVSGGESIGGDGGDGVVVIAWARTAQAITFTRPSDRSLSPTPFDIAATSDSGLTVAVTSSTPTVCTVSGVTVTMLTTGTCTLDTDQPGDIVFLPATTVSRSFTISAASSGPSSSSSTSSSSTTSTTTTTSTEASTTSVPGSTDVSACPCLIDDAGTSVPITTDATPAGQAPGGITVEDGSSTITIGDLDRGPDDPSGAAITWVNGDGALTAQTPGALMVSGSGALPGTTATGTLPNGTTGTTTVNPDGTWEVAVPVPAGTSGASTLTSTWTDVDGETRTLTVPVILLPSGDATAAPREPVDGAVTLIGPGEVLAFGHDGATVEHTRTFDTATPTISISANGVMFEISPDTGCRITDEGNLDCDPPARLRLTASGMTPGSMVDVWAMDGSSPLASMRVGPDGSLDAVIDIPASFASSLGVLQFDTVDREGRALSVALGMVSGTLPATGPTTDRLITWVLFTCAGGLLLGLLARRRPATATGPTP